MASKRKNFKQCLSLPAELYRHSEAERFGISIESLDQLLRDVVAKCLPAETSVSQIVDFYSNLHLNDFALAQSCASGHELAWEIFFERYRSKLLSTACRIAKDERRATELVDTFFTDLFAAPRGRERDSKLKSYTGRGSLLNWLKVSLVQANVDFHRAERRYADFDEVAVSIRNDSAFLLETRDDPRVEECLRAALRELEPEERFILAAYYMDRYNLAQIASVLCLHESTVSRRISSSLRTVRKNLKRKLRCQGMNAGSVDESLKRVPKEISFDLRSELLFGVELLEERS